MTVAHVMVVADVMAHLSCHSIVVNICMAGDLSKHLQAGHVGKWWVPGQNVLAAGCGTGQAQWLDVVPLEHVPQFRRTMGIIMRPWVSG